MPPSPSKQRRTLSIALAIAFAVAMLMGVGPGIYLVNRPDSFLGIPLLYAWGLLWYAVHIVIAVTAYCCLWSSNPPGDGESNMGDGDKGSA